MKHIPATTALLCFFLIGCHKQPQTSSKGTTSVDPYTKASNELYHRYLDGNRVEAKQSLEKMLELAESTKAKPFRYADTLHLIYSRLYVFELKVGDSNNAEQYLDLARWWRLESFRIGNMDPAEIKADERGFTSERCIELVLSWDRQNHGGADPAYLARQK
jgi:hypothetical protein